MDVCTQYSRCCHYYVERAHVAPPNFAEFVQFVFPYTVF